MIIAFEGINGCGKTTMIRAVMDKLKATLDDDITLTSWNSHPDVTSLITKKKIANNYSALSMCYLHCLDFLYRYEEVIKPTHVQGGIVVCDRYCYTGIVRDSIRGVNEQLLGSLYDFALAPDLLIYLDISPEKAVNRMIDWQKRSDYILGLDMNLDTNKERNFLKTLHMQKAKYDALIRSMDDSKVIVVDKNGDGCTLLDQSVEKIITHIARIH